MRLFIFGCGQIGEVARYYFAGTRQFETLFFVADDDYVSASVVDGVQVLAYSEALGMAQRGKDRWFTALSSRGRGQERQAVIDRLRGLGFHFASYVHGSAQLWRGLSVQENCFVLENSTLQYKSCLGRDSVVWSNSHIGHHTSVGPNAFITSEVVISGNCTVGSSVFFGVNSTVYDGVSIGSRVVVGAGAIVRGDVEDGATVRGSTYV